MATTAKVRLDSKTLAGTGKDAQCGLVFHADYADGRNAEWSLYTPVAEFKMTVKAALGERFTLGGSYLVTFEEESA
jgi:hypothetical protein